MIHFEAQTGGRYVYAEDVKNLQELALAFREIFNGCGNFVVSGCNISGNKMSSGYVFINNEIRYFAGANLSSTYPKYLYEHNESSNIAYHEGGQKVGRITYGVLLSDSMPTTQDEITGAAPQVITITNATTYSRISDAFFGKYGVQKSLATEQTIAGPITVNGALRSKNSITSEGTIKQVSGNYTVDSYFDNGVLCMAVVNSSNGDRIDIQVDPANNTLNVGSDIKENGKLLSEEYAKSANTYTKTQSDAKFATQEDTYTKADSDARFASRTASYTKQESDNRYTPVGTCYDKNSVYTRIQSDDRYIKRTDISTLESLVPDQNQLYVKCWGCMVGIQGVVYMPQGAQDGDTIFTLPSKIPTPIRRAVYYHNLCTLAINQGTRECKLIKHAGNLTDQIDITFIYMA